MSGIELLGATLLHFLWQGVLIAAVYAVARRCAARPEVRYVLACAALAVMAVAPAAVGFRGELPRLFTAGYEAVPSVWLSWVAAAWSVGVVVFWLRLVGGWMIAERLRRRQVRPAPFQWQQAFDRLRA